MSGVPSPGVRTARVATPPAGGSCTEVDPEAFWPRKGGDPRQRRHNTQAAIAVCMGCDVRIECLAYALNNGEWDGIWGGMTETERRAEYRRRKTGRSK